MVNDLLLTIESAGTQNATLKDALPFSICKGGHWAITGKSGAGKTALLEAIAGIGHVQGLHIQYPFFDAYKKEHSITDALFSPAKLISYVGAKYGFRSLAHTANFYYQQRFNASDSEDAPTVAQYLSSVKTYALQPFWTYQKVVDQLRLQPLLQEQLIKLSTGETKRLLLAAALLKNPVLLLLDQPLTGLDAASRAAFNDLLAAISNSGITILMATAPQEVPALMDAVMVIEDGQFIKKIPRNEYKATAAATHQSVDENELTALLSINALPKFRVIVEMKNVNIQYGGKKILDSVDWTVKQGERWALLGPNGAGKSTLLSLINGDNPQAFANDIILFDRKKGSGESIWDIKKNIGFMSSELFQYFPLETTCLQAVESGFYDTIGLYRASNPALAGIALRWLQLLGMGDAGNKLLKQLSASSQRLCLLARALVKNPPLLLLDEPCQGLDAAQQQGFKQLIENICNTSNTTLVYVTHYQEELPESIVHTLCLQGGKVINC